MLYRIRDYLARKRFDHAARDCRRLVPRQQDPLPFTLISQICSRDFSMFLTAWHSFTWYLRPTQTLLIDDGSLSPSQLEELESLIESLTVYRLDRLSTEDFQPRLCWERFNLIAKTIKESYVVQLDSDTITLEDLPEVRECILRNVSFCQGTGCDIGREIVTCKQVRESMAASTSTHVQVRAEQNLPDDDSCYVRGCAGFAGYAKNSFSPEQVLNFHHYMLTTIGEVWNTWGCDQVASNYFVANASSSVVLPEKYYCSFRAEHDYQDVRFLHFIGSYRFKKGIYRKRAREVIQRLKKTAVQNSTFKECGDTSVSGGRVSTQLGWYKLAADLVTDKHVLDVGCGLGDGMSILSNTAASVKGLEVDQQLDDENIIIGTLDTVESGSFDALVSIDVIEHIEEDTAFVADLLRVTREAICVSTPNWTASRCHWPYHVREYRPDRLVSLFSPYGSVTLYKGTPSGDTHYLVRYPRLFYALNHLRCFPPTAFVARCINLLLPESCKINSHLFVHVTKHTTETSGKTLAQNIASERKANT